MNPSRNPSSFPSPRTTRSKKHLAGLLLLFAAILSTIILPSAAGQPSGKLESISNHQIASRDGTYQPPRISLVRRHGDHGHDEEESDENEAKEKQHGMHQMNHGSQSQIAPSSDVLSQSASHDHSTPTGMQAASAEAEGHNHNDHEHTHQHFADGPESVPEASAAGSDLRPLPVWRPQPGHGGHHHGSGPVLEHLNETSLFRAKGPDPLSYIEWDFAYGLGALSELNRFVQDAAVLSGEEKMGVVDGRWRKLFDEKDQDQRKNNAADIAALVQSDGGPSRHRTTLILHVVTAILSCFVLLPMALALRAAHSNLAPLCSLIYLIMLGGSMFLSMVYKALTPRLYPENSHGGMGWAILWISLICLGSDVFRLIGQIWSVFASSKSSHSRWLADGASPSRPWQNLVSAMLGNHLPANSEKYDALEKEAMLSEEAQSDAQEIDVEKHLSQSLGVSQSRRSGSGSGSPHRVHFDEHLGQQGASSEALHDEVNWVGSGSTAVGAQSHPARAQSHPSSPLFGDRIMASPTTTACNTPRTSFLGGESTLKSLNHLKSISLWRKDAHGSASSSPVPSEAALSLSEDHVTSSLDHVPRTRLQTFKSIIRYTHVVVARTLPILGFATSYTGLAVYTGSCRNSYKMVCLAHGIKGGIFFWFGLLTFARYLGAYADCGWAWNKRPSEQNNRKQVSGWRRSMPSAEFVECLVIFVYGASNTWMERFGARAGDPYTIKQIQHISIAVMFWFAGLMGMLLETKMIRNMLSFPIAYHHAAAVPLHEVRRRRATSRNGGRQGSGGAAEENEADLLVEAQTKPASYSSSFNPFPALVIGVTGVAMAAHHQDYLYEVQIHMLWGQLLAGFALLRCLTYFLLWLRPPTASILPSRPPTEALAAFSLCCGGLVFMLSSEEVSFAAMRSGYGDFMAILNIAVAVVSLLFCWTTALMMLKGWAVRREVKRMLSGESEPAQGALQLNTDTGAGERQPRSMRAVIQQPHANTETLNESVFVLEDEEEDEQVNRSTARTTSV